MWKTFGKCPLGRQRRRRGYHIETNLWVRGCEDGRWVLLPQFFLNFPTTGKL